MSPTDAGSSPLMGPIQARQGKTTCMLRDPPLMSSFLRAKGDFPPPKQWHELKCFRCIEFRAFGFLKRNFGCVGFWLWHVGSFIAV